jgi:RHS repeat-associated protein
MDLSGTIQGAGGVGGLLAVSEHTVEQTLPGVTTFYPTYDGNGNICEYLDGTGTSKAHYEYDAFGNVTFSSGDKAADFAYRFSTKPFDFITGWYYYLYRYYDPLTGRWPSRDPIGERGGVNLYGFVRNSVPYHYDYLGMAEIVGMEPIDHGNGAGRGKSVESSESASEKALREQRERVAAVHFLVQTK